MATAASYSTRSPPYARDREAVEVARAQAARRQVFVPGIIERGRPGLVVNAGSK